MNGGLSAYGTKRTFAALQHFVRYWSNSGHWPELAGNGSVANDPKRTLRVHCGNSFLAAKMPPP
jgi:hypothetical protein